MGRGTGGQEKFVCLFIDGKEMKGEGEPTDDQVMLQKVMGKKYIGVPFALTGRSSGEQEVLHCLLVGTQKDGEGEAGEREKRKVILSEKKADGSSPYYFRSHSTGRERGTDEMV